MAVVINVVGNYDGRQIDKAIRDLDRFGRTATQAAAEGQLAFSRTADSLGQFGRRLSDTGSQISEVGSTLTRNVSLPLGLAAAAAVKSAGDFEVSMAQIRVATGLSGQSLEEMRKLALQMGADTVFSAGDAASAMLELAKAGMAPAEIQGGALSATLDLAAASGISLAEAAVVTGAGMNTFGLAAADAKSITDALAGAANASAADMPDLAQALAQVGQAAASSGLTIQETTAGLAAFADAGVRGSDAGTSLKTFLQRLVPSGEQARDLMNELGLEFFDAQGNMKSLAVVAQELQTGLGGLSQEQQRAAMNILFGADASRAATILMKEGAAGIEEYVRATSASGTAAEFAQARMEGINGSIEALKGSVETAAIQFGDALAPTVRSVAEAVTNLVNKFSALSPQTQQIIAKVALFAIALGPAIKAVGLLTSGLGAVFSAAGATVKGISIAASSISGFSSALSGVHGPAVNKYAAAAQVAGGKVRAAFSTTASRVGKAATAIGSAAAGAAKAIAAAMATAAKAVARAMLVIGRALMANPWILVAAAVAAAVVLIIRNWDKVKEFLLAAWEAIKRAASSVWNAIVDIVKKAGELVWRAIQSYFEFYKKMGEFGLRLVQGLWEGIKDAGAWIRDRLKEFAGGLVNGLKSIFGISSPAKSTMPIGREIANGVGAGIDQGKGSVKSRANDLALNVMLGLEDGVQKSGGGKKVGKKIADDLGKSLADRMTKLRDRMRDLLGGLVDSLSNQIDAMTDGLDYAIERVASAAEEMVDRARDRVSNLTDEFDRISDASREFSRNIANTVRSVFSLQQAADPESGGGFLENLRNQVQQARVFAGQVRDLRALGLNDSSIDEIIAAGVAQGSQIAAAVLSGGSTAIREINSLEASLRSEASALGDLFAQDRFGAEMEAARRNLDLAQQALSAATASRDMIVGQIDAFRARQDEILGKQRDALVDLVDQMDPTNPQSALGKVFSLMEARLIGMAAAVSARTTAQASLDRLEGRTTSSATSRTVNANVTINAASANPDEVATAVTRQIRRLSREMSLL